jgi:nicotinamidase-related amidase
MRSMSTPHLPDGTQSESSVKHHFEIIPELQPQAADVVLHKLTASGFIGTSLDGMLRSFGIQNIVLTGAATHACVEATARTGADLGYRIVLVDDACLDQSPLWHEMTMMNCIHFNWGKVVRSDELIEELSTVRPVA